MAKKGWKIFVQVLLVISALNWGLVSWFGFNLVEWIAQIAPSIPIAMFVYSIIAITGIYGAYKIFA